MVAARSRGARRLAQVAAVTAADTIYRVDRISEEAILEWFGRHWPRSLPVELVMEGLEGEAVTFPAGTPAARTVCKCILDPIDGTRSLMYDKRPAWILGAVAPQRGPGTHLGDPRGRRHDRAADEQAGLGRPGERDPRPRGRAGSPRSPSTWPGGPAGPIAPRPSRARNFEHGFASLVRFFPEGKALTARLEEELWEELGLARRDGSPVVFDDQYLSSGGQVYELLAGARPHDRRPEAARLRQAGAGLAAGLSPLRHLHLAHPGGGGGSGGGGRRADRCAPPSTPPRPSPGWATPTRRSPARCGRSCAG